MTINYLAILVCAIISMAVGSIWYGPLFGKKWMEIIGANPADMKLHKEMQKAAGPLYLIQFLLTLFQLGVLAYYISTWTNMSGLVNALWIWAGFIVPTIAGSCMWNNESKKTSWSRFLIQAGYQLVMFVIFGTILGNWR